MRITLLCNRDIHANAAVNLLLPALRAHDVTIFVSDGPSKAAALPAVFSDLVSAERIIPNRVLWPLADGAPDPGTTWASFERCAARLSGTCTSLNAPNTAEGLQTLRAAQPDLIITIRYARILRDEAISIPRFGVINLHSGPLPAFRGVLATFRGMITGASTIGCTLHRIVDAGIDTGPIIRVATLPTPTTSSLFDAVQSVYPPGAEMIADAIDDLQRGSSLPGVPPSSAGTYYSWPNADDFATFLRMGYRLVDVASYAQLLARYAVTA
ncbi:MAG: formyltransferase family protein [Gemmatimonadaceae bacterium]